MVISLMVVIPEKKLVKQKKHLTFKMELSLKVAKQKQILMKFSVGLTKKQ